MNDHTKGNPINPEPITSMCKLISPRSPVSPRYSFRLQLPPNPKLCHTTQRVEPHRRRSRISSSEVEIGSTRYLSPKRTKSTNKNAHANPTPTRKTLIPRRKDCFNLLTKNRTRETNSIYSRGSSHRYHLKNNRREVPNNNR